MLDYFLAPFLPHYVLIRSPEKHSGMAAEVDGELKRGAIVAGIDDSEHSFYALQWIIDHFFAGGGGGAASALGAGYKLVVIHAKPLPAAIIGIGGPEFVDVLPYVESDLKKIAARVIEKASHLCVANSVSDVIFEVVEGDARNVLCEAVENLMQMCLSWAAMAMEQ